MQLITTNSLISVARLQDLQKKIYSFNPYQHSKYPGVVYRLLDFTESHARLNELISNEYVVVEKVLPAALTAQDVMSGLSNERVDVWSAGADHFKTRFLAPAVRHFINDSCRLIEPMTVHLAKKYLSPPINGKVSFNSHLNEMKKLGISPGYNIEYVIGLYEIWNDYKHRSTDGVDITSWHFRDGQVIVPDITLPKLNADTNAIKDLSIVTFVDTVTSIILAIYSDLILEQPTEVNA